MAPTIRSATESDWLAILALINEVQLQPKDEKRGWWQERQRFDARAFRRKHYVVEDTTGAGTAQCLAYVGVEEGPETGQFRLFMVIAPERLGDFGDRLYTKLFLDLQDFNATLAWAREDSLDPLVTFLRNKGFFEELRLPQPGGREAVVLSKRLE